ncbi:MAG: uncharacterized protein JWN58_1272 [Gammaproteobacteria bacterium]|jgi:hypothetical protein|nr:uncharacterized protein [Gammaproteobacteria bacterium]
MMATKLAMGVCLAVLCSAVGSEVLAEEPCVDFKWDVAQERALFSGPATPLPAGADAKSAPTVQLNHLYEVKLLPQDKVVFAATPGQNRSGAANAGMLTFKLPGSGVYRVALNMPVWIDVAANGALVQPKDFQGQHSCAAPHKIVEFDLTGTRSFFLQLIGAPDSVRLTVTAAPVRKL